MRFAQSELAERKMFAMPPYGFQTAIRADAATVAEAMQFLQHTRQELAQQLPENVFQLGPAPMLMVRLAERERAQLFLESPDRRTLHQAVAQWQRLLQHYSNHKVRWSIDVDPQEG